MAIILYATFEVFGIMLLTNLIILSTQPSQTHYASVGWHKLTCGG